MSDSVAVDWRGRRVEIEYVWLPTSQAKAPLIVFLHEGLGSLTMWKDFPDRLCSVVGARGLVFSRPSYGRSTPRAPGETWDVDFMHRQAYEVLPALLDALDVVQPAWLFGHSDGGSIVLLFAGRYPTHVAGLVVLAPHIFVEDITIANIARAREQYKSCWEWPKTEADSNGARIAFSKFASGRLEPASVFGHSRGDQKQGRGT